MKSKRIWTENAKRAMFGFMLLLIFSCKKEPVCYECTTTFDMTYEYENSFEKFSTSDTQKFCEMTDVEARDYETSNTGTSTEESSGFITITVKTTKCLK